jgi:PAS domain-containing protein
VCTELLEFIENGRLGYVWYDYYQWCASGCGLYCYDVQAQLWVKVASSGGTTPSPALRSDVSEPQIVTDRAGQIVAIDQRGATLLNGSPRHLVGVSMLPFLQDGRLQLLEDVRRAGAIPLQERQVILRPRERRPRSVLISVRAVEAGVRWTIR